MFGNMHTGVLRVLCMFFDHRTARYHMRNPKGSVRFMCGTVQVPVGFIWAWKFDYVCRHRADAINGLGAETREATFVLYLPDTIWRSAGPLPAQNRRKTVRVWKYGALTGPNTLKHCAGLYSMPFDYPRNPELPWTFMWPRHKTSNAKVTWDLRVVSGP